MFERQRKTSGSWRHGGSESLVAVCFSWEHLRDSSMVMLHPWKGLQVVFVNNSICLHDAGWQAAENIKCGIRQPGFGSGLVPHWLYELGKFLVSQMPWPYTNTLNGRKLFGFRVTLTDHDLVYPGGASGEEPACQCRRHGFDPWVGKIVWRRKWLHAPGFLPGASHGQRSLMNYSPWAHKESDMMKET